MQSVISLNICHAPGDQQSRYQ